MMSLPRGACPGGGTVVRPAVLPARGPVPASLVRSATQARKGRGRFSSALFGSTARNAPAAHNPVVGIKRGAGWPARPTIDTAQQAEQDRQAWVAEAGRRMAADANRLRGRCMLRVGSIADIVRWDDLAGGAW